MISPYPNLFCLDKKENIAQKPLGRFDRFVVEISGAIGLECFSPMEARMHFLRGDFFWKFIFFASLIALVFHEPIQTLFHRVSGKEIVPSPVAPVPGELGADEQATIEIFQKMSASVCSIKNAALRQDFFSLNVLEIPQGVGSGIVWDTLGHVVTNFHVLYQANKIEVILSDHSSYEAKVVGLAADYDLALLKIQAPKEMLRPIPLGTSSDLKVGQKVLAIGNPFGLDSTLTTGIISALNRNIQSMTGQNIPNVIQTDTAINPGNSGGALLDSFGRLIGINTAILSPSGTNAGIGFAIPVDIVNRIVPQLIAHGRITRAGIGVSLLRDNLCKQWGLSGAVVVQAGLDTPAAKAGIQGVKKTVFGKLILGDIFFAIDGHPIKTGDDLVSYIEKNKKAGDSVALEWTRNGKKYAKDIVLEEI
jgi:S1-C subfamily serine protease